MPGCDHYWLTFADDPAGVERCLTCGQWRKGRHLTGEPPAPLYVPPADAMYYCPRCRVVNGWPATVTLEKRDYCDACGERDKNCHHASKKLLLEMGDRPLTEGNADGA